MGQETGRIREEIEQTRGRMSDTVDQLASKADVPSRVKESFAEKRERLMSQMRGTASRVDDATPDSDDVRQGARQAVGVAQENPIGLALGGVAFGFLAGMMIPSTRVEDEKLGEFSDNIKDQARETGGEVLDRGKQVAGDAADAARESAQDAVENVRETVKESGQQQAEEMSSSQQDEGSEFEPQPEFESPESRRL
jgi:ElaB/YqjD/DUF883 family membrane-anchored ribosome-binding protein